ncbi:MAG: ROK family protein [Actinomycetota bacterium]
MRRVEPPVGVAPTGVSGGGLADVLALFRTQGALTRAEVGELTGLARSTVNQRLDVLARLGLLVPGGASRSTGGRPPSRFEFHAGAAVILVAAIGASGMRAAVCDLSGHVMGERSSSGHVAAGPDEVLGRVDRAFDELLAAQGRKASEVAAVGVSVPGPVEHATGRVVSPPIMTGWDGFDIPGHFTRFASPVLVDNDVNAMAFGEHRTSHPGARNLLMVKVSTGVGAGIIANGSLLRGEQGAAGDIGHIPLRMPDVDREPDCVCGNRGCAEAYAGGWALLRDLREAGRPVGDLDALVALIRGGDPVAVQLARRSSRILGEVIADAVSLLNPSVVVLGGRVSDAEEQLLAGIREMVYQRSLPLATRSLHIVRTRLSDRAAVVGLALLCADEIFSAEQLTRREQTLAGSPHRTQPFTTAGRHPAGVTAPAERR